MSSNKAPSPIRSADYEAIEAALLQSTRGRWFLSEFARQNRSADTRMLLAAITKLENTVMQPHKGAQNSHMRRDLIEMAEAISKTRSEIAAMRPADVDDSKFNTATEELDAIVEATEKATSEILTAAEEVQETAWLMRENGGSEDTSNRLDALATDIYTACSFQDLTGQRTSKVVQTLRFLENRVLAMIEIWGLDDLDARDRTAEEEQADSHLLNGPARKGEGIDQAQIDRVIDIDQTEGEVIEGEITTPANSDENEAVAPAAPRDQSEAAASSEQTPALAGEAEAGAFATPAALDIDELDETKNQALFS